MQQVKNKQKNPRGVFESRKTSEKTQNRKLNLERKNPKPEAEQESEEQYDPGRT
ncbi:MAG: hypothetical protein SO015_09195 [Wujia sp.]|nr:hypothetical protein [Wujia sp.]MDY3728313.1 hypothetical protein [Wujia sp.]